MSLKHQCKLPVCVLTWNDLVIFDFLSCLFCPKRALTYKKSLTLRYECGKVPTSCSLPVVRENRFSMLPRTCWPATPGSRPISHSCRRRKRSRTWWENSGGRRLFSVLYFVPSLSSSSFLWPSLCDFSLSDDRVPCYATIAISGKIFPNKSNLLVFWSFIFTKWILSLLNKWSPQRVALLLSFLLCCCRAATPFDVERFRPL